MVPPLVEPEARAEDADPYLWLEDIDSERALQWVKAQDEATTRSLSGAGVLALQARLEKIFDSEDRIPYVSKLGDGYYNFWQDKDHVRGIWRRTTPEEFSKPRPTWETVIDLDTLSEAEGKAWVWHGVSCLPPDHRRCIVALSDGGTDADVKREFDLVEKEFVPSGFALPEAKSETAWIDADTLFVMTDTGEGSLTTSGYARTIRMWKRGTALADAPVVYEGHPTDVMVGASCEHQADYRRQFIQRYVTGSLTELYERQGDALRRVDVPADASAWVYREWLFIQLRKDWTVGGHTWPSGALMVAPYEGFMAGDRTLEALFTPTATTALESVVNTPHAVVLNLLDNVKSRIVVLQRDQGAWKAEPLAGVPSFATVQVQAVDSDTSDDLLVIATDFLTPTTLSIASAVSDAAAPRVLKSLPAYFDASGLEITQHFTPSKDGTSIPYFQVAKKGLRLHGKNPTVVYGYGGFEISMTPQYGAGLGVGWLEEGGVYVLTNIRGGGEFGPRWHEAAKKENRHLAYEDFAAIAKDLIERKVTSPEHMGAMGGSNGGLLVGNMLAQYPELWGAIVCQVPLLDMHRYTHLLAGASWMDEYGDPDDPAQWAYIRTFSPYQLVHAGVKYPPILLATSTKDDRVHPGHARKMAARLIDLGADVTYWEDTDGGHGAGITSAQRAHEWAMCWKFLWDRLK